jgi:carotenoid cleavage dioxygenase-like enzyme
MDWVWNADGRVFQAMNMTMMMDKGIRDAHGLESMPDAKYKRYTIDTTAPDGAKDAVVVQEIIPVDNNKNRRQRIEMPFVNSHRRGLKHCSAYFFEGNFAGNESESDFADAALTKVNVCDAAVVDSATVAAVALFWQEKHQYPSEGVFVANPFAEVAADGSGDDDGVVLAQVLDGEKGSSYLLVLDGKDMTELARAYVPYVIPFSLHGQFFPNE